MTSSIVAGGVVIVVVVVRVVTLVTISMIMQVTRTYCRLLPPHIEQRPCPCHCFICHRHDHLHHQNHKPGRQELIASTLLLTLNKDGPGRVVGFHDRGRKSC